MKIGKIYYCQEDRVYVQMVNESYDLSQFNTVSLIEGVNTKVISVSDHYVGRLTKVSKRDREWFLDCIIAGELVDQEKYKSKKDILIEELIETNYNLVDALEQLCPGFKDTHIIEVTGTI